jgi:hypothetical protein
MKSKYLRQGQSWTAEEDLKLYELTVSGKMLQEICEAHQRSSGGIRSRQVRLGLREKGSSTILLPPRAFKPYERTSKKNADHPKSRQADDPVASYSKTVIATPIAQSTQGPFIDRQALNELIGQHHDLIDRIWAALEKDIGYVVSKKYAQFRDRNLHIAVSRLSPGDDYYEVATLEELGDVYGITRERVRQIEKRVEKLLKIRARSGNSWVHGVLKEYRLRHENIKKVEYYIHLMRTLNDGGVASNFALFILSVMGRVDALSSSEVDQLSSAFGKFSAAKLKEAKKIDKSTAKASKKTQSANKLVSRVLAKASFQGQFAAEGISLLEMPVLRSCNGERELFSEKLGRVVQWDSYSEKRFIEALDQCDIISEFAEQSVKVEYPFEGHVRDYFVDLLVKTIDDLTIAVEIKSPVMLADAQVRAKACAAERALGRQGIGYCLVDPNGRSQDDIQRKTPSEELKSFLRATLRENKKVTMRDLQKYLSGWPSQEISDQIQSLVFRYNLDYRVRPQVDSQTGRVGKLYDFVLTTSKRGEVSINTLP